MQFRRALRALSFLAAIAVARLTFTAVQAQSPSGFDLAFQVGAPITVTGEITVRYSDDFATKSADLIHVIRDEQTGREIRLRFKNPASVRLRSGMRVTVRGRAANNEVYVAASDATGQSTIQVVGTSQPIAPSETAPVTGDQQTLVIVTNFSDKTVNPLMPDGDCSIAAINDRMFTDPQDYSVDDLYRDTSGGKVSFSGQVVGPYTIPFVSTDACDLGGWSNAADAAAAAAGIDTASYPRKVYVMPSNPVCGASGIADLGVKPSRAWVFTCDLSRVYAHELGHNLGMHHSSTESDEYGDDSDPMGSAGKLKPVNGPHKLRMGWLPGSQVVTVDADGSFDLAPLSIDAGATAPQLLQATGPNGTDYYFVSYRHATTPFEANLYSTYLDRVSVHRWAGGNERTYLLASLADGESFVDPNGFSVTQVSHGNAFATVQVKLGNGCSRRSPSIAVAPRDQSGVAGTPMIYDVSISNSDSATCAATQFSVSPSLPSGWTSALSTPSVQLSPGATGHVTLTTMSAGGAAVGTYNVGVGVSDTMATAHGASGSGTYTVVAASDSAPPTSPTGLAGKLKSKQVTLTWKPASDNVGVAGYKIWRGGVVIATTTGTTWSESLAASGTYVYFVSAYDAAGNKSGASNSVTLTLGSGGRQR